MEVSIMKYRLLVIILAVFLLFQFGFSQIPKTLNYQGYLADASGSALPDGNYNLTFRIYDVASGGSALWTEAQLLSLSSGVFNSILGKITPLSLNFDKTYWLGIQVGADPEMSPRIELTSVAYSFSSMNAETLDGVAASEYGRKPVISRLHYSGQTTDATITSAYENIRTIGNFTKLYPESDIQLIWLAHGRVNDGFCEFQLRIDDLKDTGSASTGYELASGGSAVLYTADSPINVTTIFPGLAAGTHEVSIWVRGNAASCILNFGNFGQDVFVKEIFHTATNGMQSADYKITPLQVEGGVSK
jgi:hypothetical protein